MSTQVNRLQALLERVQENRVQSRALQPQPAQAARFDAPAAAASPVRPAPAPAPAASSRAEPRSADRAKAGATPLEMAFEDQLSGAHAPPAAKPASPAREAAASFSPREAPSAPRDGAVLVDPPVTQPSKPIVQVVSKHPPSVASNFGELLKRSLSLRPR